MSNTDTPLIDRFGGPEKVYAIVVEMYKRITSDPMLAHFFEETPIDRLVAMQTEFLASALDGPIAYTGKELTAIHHGRGITGQHFSLFCNHFADAAKDHGIAENDVQLAISRIAMVKDKITGDANIDG